MIRPKRPRPALSTRAPRALHLGGDGREAWRILLAFLLCPFWTVYAALVLLPHTLWKRR